MANAHFLFTNNEPINSETYTPPSNPTINIHGGVPQVARQRTQTNPAGTNPLSSRHSSPCCRSRWHLIRLSAAEKTDISTNETKKTNSSLAAAIAQRHLRPLRLRGQRRLVQLELPHSPGYGAAAALTHRPNVAFECFGLGDV